MKIKKNNYISQTSSSLVLNINKLHTLCHQVKYRMEGNKTRTTSLYDGEAREVAHVKRVSELISKVSYLNLQQYAKI